jgi:hypothetical protein
MSACRNIITSLDSFSPIAHFCIIFMLWLSVLDESYSLLSGISLTVSFFGYVTIYSELNKIKKTTRCFLVLLLRWLSIAFYCLVAFFTLNMSAEINEIAEDATHNGPLFHPAVPALVLLLLDLFWIVGLKIGTGLILLGQISK